MDISTADITYIKRTRGTGGYYAKVTTADGRWFRFIVTESASWQRTTNYFKWTARTPSGRVRTGSGSTRLEALQNALAGR